MTRRERLVTLSAAACCMCDGLLTLQELEEFYSMTDEALHGEPHCRSCREAYFSLCRECSGRFTAGVHSLCGECASREYGSVA